MRSRDKSVLDGCADKPLTHSHQLDVVAVRKVHFREAPQVEADIRASAEEHFQKWEAEDNRSDDTMQVEGWV